MKEIIERLEQATDGSRELDLQIARHVYSESGIGNSVLDDPTDDDSPSPLLRTRAGHTYHLYIPFFTTSLDAALTLVPEGLVWTVSRQSNNLFWASCADPHDYDGNGFPSIPTPTAPLALCIAALNARADKEG